MSIPPVLKRLVFEIPDFVTAGFCADAIRRAEALGFEPATITTENGVEITPEIRYNDRVVFDDDVMAATLWARTSPMFSLPLERRLCSTIRCPTGGIRLLRARNMC